ncbi:MAG: GNAT family N-acetyltransferase [Clostridia bacterium]|nr:GNAT family N-acetyltransferase [Clostridia bacterium]MBQ8522150.1 GNAT family N-acetyltransferase [Clostridia bacterium]
MLTYKKLDRKDVSEELFKQIMVVENSTGSGYDEDIMREIWITGDKNDNFVCMDEDKVIAHISYNPKSKRRNGSIFMVNLTVLPEYCKRGIAQNLIYTATNYYIDNGYTLLTSVSVDKVNIPAVNLYQKVGFEIKDPICEADEDDEQYIMDSTLQNIKLTLDEIFKENIKIK